MDKFTTLKKNVTNMYSKCNLVIDSKNKSKIIDKTAFYIDSTIFHIVTIMYICSFSHQSRKITDESFEMGKKYLITHSSQTMSGGSRLGSATFLGLKEPMYDQNNPTNDILPVNFENGFARPQIGGGIVMDNEFKKLIMKYVTDILHYHDIKATKVIKVKIQNLIIQHIQSLFKHFVMSNQTIKLAFVANVIKQHNILHQSKKQKK
jgi:hypothetical protein